MFEGVRAHPMRLMSTSGKNLFCRAEQSPILEQMVNGGKRFSKDWMI